MQDRQLYEYAVIRIVPKIEREEFINVGLVMFCKQKRWIRAEYTLKTDLLNQLSPETDAGEITSYLSAFKSIAAGSKDSGPIGQLDAASRFRWLTAVRSSVLQTSRPHPGMCTDIESRFDKLFEDLVL